MFKMLFLYVCFIIIWLRLLYFVDDRYLIYMLKGEGNKILIVLKLGELWKKVDWVIL